MLIRIIDKKDRRASLLDGLYSFLDYQTITNCFFYLFVFVYAI